MGDFAPVDLTSTGYARMAYLMNTYESLPLGTTDASDLAIIEPLGLTDVAALGRRHLTVVRPSTRMRWPFRPEVRNDSAPCSCVA
jgi:uncharacterized protein